MGLPVSRDECAIWPRLTPELSANKKPTMGCDDFRVARDTLKDRDGPYLMKRPPISVIVTYPVSGDRGNEDRHMVWALHLYVIRRCVQSRKPLRNISFSAGRFPRIFESLGACHGSCPRAL
jgi:hypothetical protein